METEQLLSSYSAEEKTAYLAAIASIASADRKASEEELNYLQLLSEEAGLGPTQQADIMKAAEETSDTQLTHSLDILKSSELKYSLMADLLNFAKSDSNYSPEEKVKIEAVANYLEISHPQYEALNQFADKAAQASVQPEQAANPNFLSTLGLEEKFKSAGLNFGTIGKGLLGFLAPLIISKMTGSRSRGNNGGMGGLGNILGGMGGSGGLGGMLSGLGSGKGNGSGGLGSLISVLSGGRGLGSAGGLLSKFR